MSEVFSRPGSACWYARVKTWNGSKWVWRKHSTGTEDKDAAQKVADEMQRMAMLAGPGEGGLDRKAVFELAEKLLEASGGLSKPWKLVAEDWLEMRQKRIKASSYARYRSHVTCFNRWLGKRIEMPAAAIDLKLAQEYYDAMHEDGLASKTANENIKTLAAVCERAIAEGVMNKNPWKGVERRYGGRREREPFTMDDVFSLLKTCSNGRRTQKHARDWQTMIYLALCTGARAGDCRAMTWENIKTNDEGWVLVFSPEKKEGKGSEKGRSISIPVIEPLLGHLKTLKHQSGPLCPSLVNTAVSSRGGISAQFRAIVDQSGIPMVKEEGKGERGNNFRSKTFHSFRHTLNSILFNSGVPDEWRMRILDHESQAVNRGYSHAEVKTMRKYLEGVDLTK